MSAAAQVIGFLDSIVFIPLILAEVPWLLVSFREMTRNKAKQMHIYILHIRINVNVAQSSKATDPYLRSC